jgi:hypothetical protein
MRRRRATTKIIRERIQLLRQARPLLDGDQLRGLTFRKVAAKGHVIVTEKR